MERAVAMLVVMLSMFVDIVAACWLDVSGVVVDVATGVAVESVISFTPKPSESHFNKFDVDGGLDV
jgi:hypothetical protein